MLRLSRIFKRILEKKRPVQCKLYKATNGNMVLSSESIVTQVNDLSNMPNPPPFSYLLSDQEPSMQINTSLSNVPLGSCLSYHLFDLENQEQGLNITLKSLQILIQAHA